MILGGLLLGAFVLLGLTFTGLSKLVRVLRPPPSPRGPLAQRQGVTAAAVGKPAPGTAQREKAASTKRHRLKTALSGGVALLFFAVALSAVGWASGVTVNSWASLLVAIGAGFLWSFGPVLVFGLLLPALLMVIARRKPVSPESASAPPGGSPKRILWVLVTLVAVVAAAVLVKVVVNRVPSGWTPETIGKLRANLDSEYNGGDGGWSKLSNAGKGVFLDCQVGGLRTAFPGGLREVEQTLDKKREVWVRIKTQCLRQFLASDEVWTPDFRLVFVPSCESSFEKDVAHGGVEIACGCFAEQAPKFFSSPARAVKAFAAEESEPLPTGDRERLEKVFKSCDEELNRDRAVKTCITAMGAEKKEACECLWKEGPESFGGTDAFLKALRDSKNQQLNATDRARLEEIRRSCGASQ
jgi:hypothetical protein